MVHLAVSAQFKSLGLSQAGDAAVTPTTSDHQLGQKNLPDKVGSCAKHLVSHILNMC